MIWTTKNNNLPTQQEINAALLKMQQATQLRFLVIHVDVSVASSQQLISEERQPQVIWFDGSSDQMLIGYGIAWTHTIESDDPFEQAKSISSMLFKQLVEIGESSFNQILFAGFSFQPKGQELTGDWQHWPRNQLLLPKMLVVHNADSSQATFSFCFDTHLNFSSDAILRVISQALKEQEQRQQEKKQSTEKDSSVAFEMHVHDKKPQWEQKINDIQEQIRLGNLHKVVTARAAMFTTPRAKIFSKRRSFLALCEQNPNCYTFIFGPHQENSFMGASPETLIRYHKGAFHTQALAGTIPRSSNPTIDQQRKQQLLRSTKNRTEQGYVVNAIYESLQTICNDVQVEKEPHILALPSLFHLNTSLSGNANQQTHVLDLVSLLHPTPALGGWPSLAAQQWLSQHEDLERGWYGGPLGWFDGQGNGVFCVAIRSALIGDKTAFAYGGAGIVEASIASSEWLETELKFKTITQALRTKEEKK